MASGMSELQELEELLDSGYRLIAYEAQDSGAVYELFEALDRATGRAAYRWLPGGGFRRLTVDHIPIPETGRPGDALDYIRDRKHYGIFLLEHFDRHLKDPDLVKELEAIATSEEGPERIVILLGTEVWIPPRLLDHTVQIRDHGRDAAPA